MAVEDIGGLYNTKQPGYDDAADIQAALKAFLYGSYDYDTTDTDPTQLPNPSLAHHLQGLKDRIEDQEELGIGSDYLTLAEIGALTGVADGYIAMASDSNGGAVESLYASAFYTNEAPTADIVDGVLWVDKDSSALDTYVYNATDEEWVRINDLKNIIESKGDLLIGSGSSDLDNLPIGANGTVLTADDTQTLGVKWETPSVYSDPTLGSTTISSGSTVSNINDLTINSTTIPTSKTLVATDSTEYVIPSMSGNSGKYLTNDGSTPSWATVSSGGMTLISTATPSGAATISFTSIPQTYKKLFIYGQLTPSVSGDGTNSVVFNSDTTNKYRNDAYHTSGQFLTFNTNFQLHNNMSNTKPITFAIELLNYTENTDSAMKIGFVNCYGWYYTIPTQVNTQYKGYTWAYSGSNITSIDFNAVSGTYTGTISLYGVA